jgi:putative membrane protein
LPQTDKPQPDMTGPRLVYLAAERTLLTWVRTALGLMAFGFVIDRFELVLRINASAGSLGQTHPEAYSLWMGTVLVIAGVVMIVVAAVRYLRFAAHYRREADTEPGPGLSQAVLFTAVIALLVSGIVVYLITLSR